MTSTELGVYGSLAAHQLQEELAALRKLHANVQAEKDELKSKVNERV